MLSYLLQDFSFILVFFKASLFVKYLVCFFTIYCRFVVSSLLHTYLFSKLNSTGQVEKYICSEETKVKLVFSFGGSLVQFLSFVG